MLARRAQRILPGDDTGATRPIGSPALLHRGHRDSLEPVRVDASRPGALRPARSGDPDFRNIELRRLLDEPGEARKAQSGCEQNHGGPGGGGIRLRLDLDFHESPAEAGDDSPGEAPRCVQHANGIANRKAPGARVPQLGTRDANDFAGPPWAGAQHRRRRLRHRKPLSFVELQSVSCKSMSPSLKDFWGSLTFVFYCTAVGVYLVLRPWTPATGNASPFLRGFVSGLGLLHLLAGGRDFVGLLRRAAAPRHRP